MMSKLYEQRLRSDLFKLSIMTLITVMVWIGIATYQSLTKSKVSKMIKVQIKPLTATLDLDTIKDVKSRQKIVSVDWRSLSPQLPEGLLLPEKLASESSQLEEQSGASSSGEKPN